MNMIQGIFNVYWSILFKHTKKWLKIACLSKDIMNCYFETSKLTLFCNHDCPQYLGHFFISNNCDDYKLAMNIKSDIDIVAQIAVDFHVFIVEAHQQTSDANINLEMIIRFIFMTNNIGDFVDCYYCQNSVGAEHRYYNSAPMWKMNGQNEYTQCWVEQLHQRIKKHMHSLIHTYRCHQDW